MNKVDNAEIRKELRRNNKDKHAEIVVSRLRSAILSSGMTSKEIANLCHITPAIISSYMTGRAMPTLTIAISLSDILNISIDDLCGRQGNYKPIIMCESKKALKIMKLQEELAKLMAE